MPPAVQLRPPTLPALLSFSGGGGHGGGTHHVLACLGLGTGQNPGWSWGDRGGGAGVGRRQVSLTREWLGAGHDFFTVLCHLESPLAEPVSLRQTEGNGFQDVLDRLNSRKESRFPLVLRFRFSFLEGF